MKAKDPKEKEKEKEKEREREKQLERERAAAQAAKQQLAAQAGIKCAQPFLLSHCQITPATFQIPTIPPVIQQSGYTPGQDGQACTSAPSELASRCPRCCNAGVVTNYVCCVPRLEETDPSPEKPAALPRKASEAGAGPKPPKEPVTPTGRTAIAVNTKADTPTAASNAPPTPVRVQTAFSPGPTSPMASRQDHIAGSSRHVSTGLLPLLHNALLTGVLSQ